MCVWLGLQIVVDVLSVGLGQRLVDQAEPMARFLHGEAPLCDAKEGRDTLRLVLACYLSAKEGKRVSVYDERINEL